MCLSLRLCVFARGKNHTAIQQRRILVCRKSGCTKRGGTAVCQKLEESLLKYLSTKFKEILKFNSLRESRQEFTLQNL
ncbi:MAG: (2Fe-2S) ferredoxin domain-containing protein [Moorea sp. SIO2B7]|nr:(2Fe-2S) ferredoxin domain-containing protein [Moorena sp. SIO2B7]